MNNLYLAFSVVCPICLMMALGYFLRRINILQDATNRSINNLCFKAFLPVLLFVNVYNSDFATDFSLGLILFGVACMVIAFAALMFIVPLFEKSDKRRGVIVQGVMRSNFILFGLPVTIAVFGESNASVTAILISFIVPLINILSVIALEVYSGKRTSLKRILLGVATNPLVVAAVIAFAFVLLGVRMPAILTKTLTDISRIATPLALILLGGSFTFTGALRNIKTLCVCVTSKLVVIPAICLSIAIALGFRDRELMALFSMIASPTAVASFTMAQSAGADSDLAGEIVVMTSIASIITVFAGIMILKQLAFI